MVKNKELGSIYLFVIIFAFIANYFFTNITISIVTSILLLMISLVGIKVYVNNKVNNSVKTNKFLLTISIIMLGLSIVWIILNIFIFGFLYLGF
ncbi:hypothetical protein [Clostridium sp. OS1-26]|uniref:hypothetical protein n=1 Tax=Clostridium sp. OS1-26 TaxID=3070681 RepID=UPI0027DFDF7B|nr:hypothetical protein [Clostridium sp. OS1-26]WML37494.1 hypothetical protein RCG18_13285 [Clostridium sp. OS1-26]